MARKVSEDLQRTVKANPHIQEVHFTKSGQHFFNAHDYKEKGQVKGKYGRLGVEAVHVRNEGDRKIYKNEFVPLEEYKIVETLTREEVLAADILNPSATVEAKSNELKKAQEENAKLKQQLEELKAKK